MVVWHTEIAMEWLGYLIISVICIIFGGFFFFIELEILTSLKILKLETMAKDITLKGWLIIALATFVNAFLVFLTFRLMPYIIPYKYIQNIDGMLLPFGRF